MKCGGCRKTVRKTELVWTQGKGVLVQKRLGACCAKNAATILIGSIEASACKCGNPATTCVGCARDGEKKDARKILAEAVEKLRKLAKVYAANPRSASVSGDESFADGRAAGLEQAADFLEAGDFT